MAPIEGKRKIPPKVAKMQERKRRRLEGNETKAPAKNTSSKKSDSFVNIDKLAWKAVSMPDKLDDYEGFFGLEELDDVDVVRDTSTGKVAFRAVETSNKPKKGKQDSGPEKDSPQKTRESHDEIEGQPDEEWEGFTEDESQRSSENSPEPIQTGAFAGLQEEALDDDNGVQTSAWDHLKLSDSIVLALSKMGFSKPTPIQNAAIPDILAGHDVIGKASTGSGKTLAFGLPIIESWLESRDSVEQQKKIPKHPIALILSPTRELAKQITEHLAALCSMSTFDQPSIATLTGGLSIQKQRRLLENADIVIATPGRLWEVISEGHGILAQLKLIEFLVVDEADRLLSSGHFKELEEILNALDRKDYDEGEQEESEEPSTQRQTLVFSATFNKGLQQKLSGKGKPGGELMSGQESMAYLLKKLRFREPKPKFIDVNPVSQMAEGLKEGLIECAGTEKDLYLYTLLLLHPHHRTLIFTNSISAVRRLAPLLQNLGLPALPLHSHMPQKARLRSLERFSKGNSLPKSNQKPKPNGHHDAKQSGNASILIATDVAARGLDIPAVQLIIHYHLPRAADTYVHRSGRTARAENKGSSILICAPEEVAGVRRLVAKVHAQGSGGKNAFFIRTLDIDRKLASRLKPRVTLAKKIADTTIAKEKKTSNDSIWKQAAEDLGVDYDSDDPDEAPGRRGRGSGRRKKEKEAASLSKEDVQAMRAELKAMLSQRVNTGVSQKYITGGEVDIKALMRGEKGEFLGRVDGLGLEDD